MVMSIKLLALAATAASSTPACPHGSCAEGAVRESSVLLQRRKGRVMPLKLAEQAASEEKKSGSEDLVAAAKAMLREGTTNDELDFANYTMRELEETVLPALLNGHEGDQELLDSMLAHFQQAEGTFAEHRREIEGLEGAEASASNEHHSCRAAMDDQCGSAITCETERTRLWRIYKETESEYLAAVHLIHNQWCEHNENRSTATWMESQERKFEQYFTLGEERITRIEAHDEEKTRCQETNHSISVAASGCDELKRELEHTSCTRLSLYNRAVDELDASWKIATETFDQVITAVKIRHSVRTQELKSLGSIKCLLKHIFDRSMKPCDEADVPGEFTSIVDECEGYWKIDMTGFDWAGDFAIPDLPVKPSEPAGMEPCSSEYLSEHYGEDGGGDCRHDLPACISCAEHAQPSCAGGQVWNTCGSECEKTCEEPQPSCTEQCVEKCECPPSQPILKDGVCIAEAQCAHHDGDDPESGQCTGGQVWNECGSECEKTCEEPQPFCTEQCVKKCECPPSHPLLQEGVCIAEAHCAHHDADENKFQKTSAWNISGKVLMMLGPVANPLECADKCNDVDACVAFRYFTEPARGCELLSEVDPNSGHNDEKTISYQKNVVQEIIFVHFADQPEFDKITFASIDLDNNHKLDMAEFRGFYDLVSSRILGEVYNAMPDVQKQTNAKNQLDQMDLNGDGFIDRSEGKSTKYLVDALVSALTTWATMMSGFAQTGAVQRDAAQVLLQLYSGEVSVDGEFGAPTPSPASEPRGTV